MSQPDRDTDEVRQYYEHMTKFFAILTGKNFHFGYWPEDHPEWTLQQAQDHLTDLFIRESQVTAASTVLDVGCGLGHPALRLVKATGCSAIGITIVQAQVELANRFAAREGLSARAEFRLADAMDLPFAGDSFDAAWALESIFHMPSRRQVLEGIRRVLRPGGRLVLTDVHPLAALEAHHRKLVSKAFQIQSFMELSDYPGELEAAGLRAVEVRDITPQTRPNVGFILRSMAHNRELLRKVYAGDGFENLEKTLPAWMKIYGNGVGFCLVVAEKPRPPESA